MKLLFGLIPCASQHYLDMAWQAVGQGVEEVAGLSMDEYTAANVYQQIFTGQGHLYMAYEDKDNTPEDQEANAFVKKIQTPLQDYVGFAVVQLLPQSFHIFQAYLRPEYRSTEAFMQCADYLEKKARFVKAPYISLSTNPAIVDVTKIGFRTTSSNYRKKL